MRPSSRVLAFIAGAAALGAAWCLLAEGPESPSGARRLPPIPLEADASAPPAPAAPDPLEPAPFDGRSDRPIPRPDGPPGWRRPGAAAQGAAAAFGFPSQGTGSLEGTVRMHALMPPVSVAVRHEREGWIGPESPPPQRLAAGGRFRVAGVPPGIVEVQVFTSKGAEKIVASVAIVAGETTVDPRLQGIDLEPDRPMLVATVLAPQGGKAVGCNVYLKVIHQAGGRMSLNGVTDAEGSISFPVAPGGRTLLHAVDAQGAAAIVADPPRACTVQLEAPARVDFADDLGDLGLHLGDPELALWLRVTSDAAFTPEGLASPFAQREVKFALQGPVRASLPLVPGSYVATLMGLGSDGREPEPVACGRFEVRAGGGERSVRLALGVATLRAWLAAAPPADQ